MTQKTRKTFREFILEWAEMDRVLGGKKGTRDDYQQIQQHSSTTTGKQLKNPVSYIDETEGKFTVTPKEIQETGNQIIAYITRKIKEGFEFFVDDKLFPVSALNFGSIQNIRKALMDGKTVKIKK